jgi:hypothetical protein
MEPMKPMMQKMDLRKKPKPKQAPASQSPWLKILFSFVVDSFVFSCILLWMVNFLSAVIVVGMSWNFVWTSFMPFKHLSSGTFDYVIASSDFFLLLAGMLCFHRSLSFQLLLPNE